jgi:hypothetical protein
MRLSTLTATLAVAATTALADGLIKLDYIQVEPVQNLTNSSGTILAKPVVAWYSIPYAAPPLGDLRFKKPQPPTAGRGNKNGTVETLALKDYGPWCRQGPANKGESEDCLTLSIFRPQGIPNEKLPVVIWVPGGELSWSLPQCVLPRCVAWISDGTRSTKMLITVIVFLNYNRRFQHRRWERPERPVVRRERS